MVHEHSVHYPLALVASTHLSLCVLLEPSHLHPPSDQGRKALSAAQTYFMETGPGCLWYLMPQITEIHGVA